MILRPVRDEDRLVPNGWDYLHWSLRTVQVLCALGILYIGVTEYPRATYIIFRILLVVLQVMAEADS
jgi:hypothetical protein